MTSPQTLRQFLRPGENAVAGAAAVYDALFGIDAYANACASEQAAALKAFLLGVDAMHRAVAMSRGVRVRPQVQAAADRMIKATGISKARLWPIAEIDARSLRRDEKATLARRAMVYALANSPLKPELSEIRSVFRPSSGDLAWFQQMIRRTPECKHSMRLAARFAPLAVEAFK